MFRKLTLILLFWGTFFIINQPNQLYGLVGFILTVRNVGIISLIIALIPKKLDILLSSIILLFISIYIGVQSTYFDAFTLYGLTKTLWSMKSGITEFNSSVMEFISFADIKYIFIPFLYGVISIIAFKKVPLFHKKEKKINYFSFISLVLIISVVSGFIFDKNLSNTETEDLYLLRTADHYVYNSVENVNSFVNRFGLFNLIFRDLSSYLFHPYAESPNIEDEITAILQNNKEIQTSNYSGIFEFKNLILIEAESLNNFAIDPVLTPTLYKLKTEGFFIEGYNSPLLTGSTSDSEFLALTSIYPTFDGKITFNDYASNVYPQTIANLFSAEGYYSMAAHNSLGWFYNRTTMMVNLGFDFFDPTDMKLEDHSTDSVVLDYIKWIPYGMDKFFTFYITYDAHQPYSVDSLSEIMKSYLTTVQNHYPDLPIAEQVYLAKNMDLDTGLKQLLKDYSNSNILDDTVIMIYGDHYPKGLFENKSDYEEICNIHGISLETCFDTPLIIYNSEIKGEVIQKVSSTIDISPTIIDLFSLDYNPKLIFGHSIFDPSYDGFCFDAWDVIETDNYIYDSGSDSIVEKDYSNGTKDIDEARRLFYEFSTLRQIVPMNYFANTTYNYSDIKE